MPVCIPVNECYFFNTSLEVIISDVMLNYVTNSH